LERHGPFRLAAFPEASFQPSTHLILLWRLFPSPACEGSAHSTHFREVLAKSFSLHFPVSQPSPPLSLTSGCVCFPLYQLCAVFLKRAFFFFFFFVFLSFSPPLSHFGCCGSTRLPHCLRCPRPGRLPDCFFFFFFPVLCYRGAFFFADLWSFISFLPSSPAVGAFSPGSAPSSFLRGMTL